MHLLNVHTRRLEEFVGWDVPPYGILSHTWDKNEIVFRDLSRPDHRESPGYAQIEGCCQQVVRDGLDYVWIDTCCIDKSSSAELSEAINSMFKWYENAEKCYVYLVDVPDGDDPFASDSAFRHSRWFTRGWTLQELIAPRNLTFYTHAWTVLFSGALSSNYFSNAGPYRLLQSITRIPGACLAYPEFYKSYSIGVRLSWASNRVTTREEDMAYCLLGIVEVNMPLLYGEGAKAFLRLQEEILKFSDDLTILAWGYGMPFQEIMGIIPDQTTPVFAPSPALFKGFYGTFWNLEASRLLGSHSLITNYGLLIEMPLLPTPGNTLTFLGILDENTVNQDCTVLPLVRGAYRDVCYRAPGCAPFRLRRNASIIQGRPKRTKIYIQKCPERSLEIQNKELHLFLDYGDLRDAGYNIHGFFGDGSLINRFYSGSAILISGGHFTGGAVVLFSRPDDDHSSFAVRIGFPKFRSKKAIRGNARITFVHTKSKDNAVLEFLKLSLPTISWRAGLSHPLHSLQALLHARKQTRKDIGHPNFQKLLRDDATGHVNCVTVEGDAMLQLEALFPRVELTMKIHQQSQSERVVP